MCLGFVNVSVPSLFASLSVTEACTGEEGCTKRYISHQGCPYTPPSEFYKVPKCFFDDSVELIYKDPCESYGEGEDKDKPEEDPSNKWDPTHKYEVIKGTPSQKIKQVVYLFKNAFVDVCPPPNSYDIFGIIVGNNFFRLNLLISLDQ